MAAVLRCRECVAAVPGAVWTMAGRCDSCRYVAPQREVRAMLRWECLLDALPLLVDYDRVFCARAACVGRGHDYALDVKWAWSVEQEEARGRRRLLRPDPMGPHVEEYEDPVVWDGFEWVPNPSRGRAGRAGHGTTHGIRVRSL